MKKGEEGGAQDWGKNKEKERRKGGKASTAQKVVVGEEQDD